MTLELGSFFERYAERYMAGDAEAIADMCEAPFLAVRSGKAFHLPDREAVVGHLATNMTAYRSAGAASADIADIDVQEQGSEAVLATVHWHVRGPDGTMVRDFRTSYQLVVADPWRIVSYVNHDRVAHDGS
ncbi:MAG: DUF4440 domain-containing protein [Chloroflexota bacterium]